MCLLQQESSGRSNLHTGPLAAATHSNHGSLEKKRKGKKKGGSQESLGGGSAEAADLLPERSAGSRELQRAAPGRC